ncbi:MAG TPA: VOC family protein [Burkholderiales bacterium]|nr:VOC family protein [Burkholderiales bacterium]
MLTRIDCVTIGVADLDAGIEAYRRIGFDVDAQGVARADGDRLELVRGKDGIRSVAIASDDPAADAKRGGAGWIDLVPPERAPAGKHPNRVLRIERVYIAVKDLGAAVERYSRALGVAPKMERGTVIHADMAIYPLGPTGLGLAQPVAPGVCADALERRGPGPFQILYRTASMDAAAAWIAGHGLPPPVRGVRNTGEEAMLVGPEYACGVYVGFVGPAQAAARR